jgi:hypothetical protein
MSEDETNNVAGSERDGAPDRRPKVGAAGLVREGKPRPGRAATRGRRTARPGGDDAARTRAAAAADAALAYAVAVPGGALMSMIAQCDRCRSQNSILTTRRFGLIDVTVVAQDQPNHVCPDCLSELLQEAVISLADNPTAKDYSATLERAAQTSKAFAAVERANAENDVLKQKLAEARSQATAAGQYAGWVKEKASLHEKIEALEAARDVALSKAAQAETRAAEVVKRAAAAQVQAKVEDPHYVESVAAREAKRASAR